MTPMAIVQEDNHLVERIGCLWRSSIIWVRKTNHACAANGCLPLLNKILGLLPEPSQQTQLALNHPDVVGFTPIMIVADKASRNESAITMNESIEFKSFEIFMIF